MDFGYFMNIVISTKIINLTHINPQPQHGVLINQNSKTQPLGNRIFTYEIKACILKAHSHSMSQWRNVISGAPRFKIFEDPLVKVPKARVGAPCMHEFSTGSRACSPGKFLNLESLKCHFPDFGERLYRILMVRKRHCNISEASLANVFALHPEPGGPDLVHWGWGPPGSPGPNP